MAFIRLYLFASLLVVIAEAQQQQSNITRGEAQQQQSNITRGSSLTPKSSPWLSNSGLFALGFYEQGNGFAVGIFVAGIPEKTVVWTANRDNSPVAGNATLLFTAKGSLVLQSTGGQIDIADPNMSAVSASMLDSGNFVFYNSDGKIIWQSFDNPTDTLLPTQRLLEDKEIISSISKDNPSQGIFRLIMQKDGNLVQYPIETSNTAEYAYYSSGTFGRGPNVSLNFDADGNLYLLNKSSINIRNISDGGVSSSKDTIFRMTIDADGVFRVYSHSLTNSSSSSSSWQINWQSTNDKCTPKGLCGLNGFCVLNDQETNCQCLPGFEAVKQGNWTSGCERNFTAVSCGNQKESLSYTIEEVPNTVWEDVSYKVLSSINKEDCRQACFDDCNCEAALYQDGNCRKQRLPLKYGRRDMSSSNIALIRVGNPISTPPDAFNKERFVRRKIRKNILIINVILVTLGASMLSISIFVLFKSHSLAYKKIPRNIDVESSEDFAPRSYTYAELEAMTDDFNEEIGKGSFGTVYRGTILNTQKVVAIKRLEKQLFEGENEFQNEIKAIGRTHHKNLVCLLGFCHEGPNRLLVYEYMRNGTLADILFTPENKPNWDDRVRIASNISMGVLYLHEECGVQIIHCDLKPQNILMDEYGCPRISDFGLAKLLKPDQTRTFTGIRGTRGYVAPEWHKKMPITVKADVYSFGIVLLEIICCRRNVEWNLSEEESLLEEWVYLCFENGELGKLVSNEEVDKRELERMVRVALWCIQDEPSLRPTMKKVLLMLEGTVEIPIPPSPNSFLSTI